MVGGVISEVIAGIDAAEGDNVWTKRVNYLQPRNVLELGTGQGSTSALIMAAMSVGARLTTINYDYPDNQEFGVLLHPWRSDRRLHILCADTLSPPTLDHVPDRVDLLFIDTEHRAWYAAEELRLWQRKLKDGAVVVVDDLDHHDMIAFWESIPYGKAIVGNQGLFLYGKPYYTASFPRGKTPKEIADGFH